MDEKIFYKNIWQFEKNKFIFATQNKILKTINVQRIQLHIEAMNGFSPKRNDTICGACYADE